MADFDAIVIGSGMSGGWAAKELCERGLKVLLLDRGKRIQPSEDYSDLLSPWEFENFNRIPEEEAQRKYASTVQHIGLDSYLRQSNKHFFATDSQAPYQTNEPNDFYWVRAYSSGGKSLIWSRQTYRFGPQDFDESTRDGHGIAWPISYNDLAPWYDHVERFAGIAGSLEGLPQLPDGVFQPPFELNCAEEWLKQHVKSRYPHRDIIPARAAHLTEPTSEQIALGRGKCMARRHCDRGCSIGAYFSSVSATLPAAERTGLLTHLAHQIVHSLITDSETGSVIGVRAIDAQSGKRQVHSSRMVFLNASTIASTIIMLNSASPVHPRGLANSSGQLGLNLMDHVGGARASGKVPGFEDRYYSGRRPAAFYIPRYRNIFEDAPEFKRGFSFQGMAWREGWSGERVGIGKQFKQANRAPGQWKISAWATGEMLPDPRNAVRLHPTRTDPWGVPLPVIDIAFRENELKMMQSAGRDIGEMLRVAGCTDVVEQAPQTTEDLPVPGSKVHEAGTARMGADPALSVLDGWGRAHDCRNLFVTDGACMPSSPCQNPSLTYMALAARAANFAADEYAAGNL